MELLKDVECNVNRQIGGKAKNLFKLMKLGFNVPKWIVIPESVFNEFLPNSNKELTTEEILLAIQSYKIPDFFIEEIVANFNAESFFAVRSSASEEDGSDFSFAGQFDSFLYVTKDRLAESIKKVWISVLSERVVQYRNLNKIKGNHKISVIVQEMIPAEIAGVAFGINPANGARNEKIISAVYGLGEGLVSGELDSDNFVYKNDEIIATIATKTHQIVLDNEAQYGTKKCVVAPNLQLLPTLSTEQIFNIIRIVDQCRNEFGKAQDIEFAISNGQIYLLQTRPITILQRLADAQGEYTLWDNSNIIESYPGVTTPLTFSFISKSYERAYRVFCELLGVSLITIQQNERIFANTLGFINGRVYYNLKSWYHILAMLPGYSINARFMEKMMGVKERFDIPETYHMSKTAAWWSVFKMGIKIYYRFLMLPKNRKQFMTLLNHSFIEYKKNDLANKNANELISLYQTIENKLLNEWKAPLVNDFFAMIWFGMLQKRCEKYGVSNNPNIHNDLLCGSSDIISTQPIHRCIDLATKISNNSALKKLFLQENEDVIWRELNENIDWAEMKQEIHSYLADFGERCVGELKLETISLTQQPSLFIKTLKTYVETGITLDRTSRRIEEELRSNAELEVNQALKYKPLKKFLLKRTLKHARDLVSSRENLRYERTRAFGMVREIFSAIGQQFYAEGIIEYPRDIFYLGKEEIISFIEGTSLNQDIKALIALRKSEFEIYRNMPPPSERFATYGPIYHANDFFSTNKIDQLEGNLKGIGCCPGRIRAKAIVVMNPSEVTSLNDCILITSSTDPGWVTLFPSAAGIIVERGSLLSHSAIVSREMGKPCIVSVTGLLKTIKTGDEIEMDGSTGEIKIINSAS